MYFLIKNIFKLVGGNAFAQIIAFAATPVLTRLYTPEDFGQFSFFSAVASVIAILATGRYEFAILLSDSMEKTRCLLVVSLGLALLTALAVVTCVTTADYFVVADSLIFALPVWVFFLAMASIFEKISNKERRYGIISAQKIVTATAAAAVSIFVGWTNNGSQSSAFGLIAGAIVGPALSVLLVFLVLRKQTSCLSFASGCFSTKSVFSTLKLYRHFPAFNLPHAMINTAAGNAPVFLIPIFFADALLGVYSLGVRVIQAPLSLFVSSLYNVLSQKFFDVRQRGGSLSDLYEKYVKYIFGIVLFLFPIFWFLEDPMAYVFGAKWSDAGKYIRILSPYLLFVLMVGPFAFVPVLLGKQRQALQLEIFASSTKVISLVVGGLTGNFELMLILFSLSGFLIQLWTLNWYRKLLRSADFE